MLVPMLVGGGGWERRTVLDSKQKHKMSKATELIIYTYLELLYVRPWAINLQLPFPKGLSEYCIELYYLMNAVTHNLLEVKHLTDKQKPPILLAILLTSAILVIIGKFSVLTIYICVCLWRVNSQLCPGHRLQNWLTEAK